MARDEDENALSSTGMRLLGRTAGGFAGMAVGLQAADYITEKLGVPGEPVSILGAAALGAYSGMVLGGKNPYKANLILGGAIVAYAAREHMRDRITELKAEFEKTVEHALEQHGAAHGASNEDGTSTPSHWDDGHHLHYTLAHSVHDATGHESGDMSDLGHIEADPSTVLG